MDTRDLSHTTAPSSPESASSREPMAVIDIGSTGIRMSVAEARPGGSVHNIDFLHQSISLGKDTFSTGVLSRDSIRQSIATLKSFRRVCADYGIRDTKHIRVVATNAVREAKNSDVFIDQVELATGYHLECIDDNDIARWVYLSYDNLYGRRHEGYGENELVCEVSGGSNFMLYLQNDNVEKFVSNRFGALRTYEMLGREATGADMQDRVIRNRIQRTIGKNLYSEEIKNVTTIIALGGDINTAARHLAVKRDSHDFARIRVSDLAKFTDMILSLTVYECMKKLQLSFTDAEIVGPALLFYTLLAKSLGVRTIIASPIAMRHGVMLDMYDSGGDPRRLESQIERSVFAVGRKFNFEENHGRYCARLSTELFNVLKKDHALSSWMLRPLTVAAYLHDIGLFISPRDHHKHSMYCIRHSEIFGLNKKELYYAALIARYHRGAGPKPSHEEFTHLAFSERMIITKLAAILRISDALDRSNTQQIQKIECVVQGERFIIEAQADTDLTIESMALQEKNDLFVNVFGMDVILRKKPTSTLNKPTVRDPKL